MNSPSALLVGALLAGCSGDAEAPNAGPAADAPAAPEFKLDLAMLSPGANTAALVPSPVEMQRALGKAGLTSSLAEAVSQRGLHVDGASKDRVAVLTGVLMADLLLTLKSAEKAGLIGQIGTVKAGLILLGAGDSVVATLDDISNRVANDAVNRDDLVRELDELSGIALPAIEYQAGSWVVPLIQAGGWVEGAHLVSGAITAEGKVSEAGHLLRQPKVVEHFLTYVQREGSARASDEVVAKLEQSLLTLKEITSKDVLSGEDIQAIHGATGDVLGML